MQAQRGNLLLQALLALTLVFAFVPFVATRLSGREGDARMYTATRQVENAAAAARIFLRENAANLPYDRTVVAGDSFADILEPYGLPMGFVPRTPLGQDISLVIDKTPSDVSAYLELTGGGLGALRRAELARRIGFYAAATDDGVRVAVALEAMYSDVVRRNEPDINNTEFMTDLDMGNFSLENAGRVIARRGDFETAQFGTLSVVGTENGRKIRSNIASMEAVKTIFQSRTGESALSLTRGTLFADSVSGRTVARFGETGNFSSLAASVDDFSMTAGRTGFTGPEKWDVRGNVVSNRVSFRVERLDVEAHINATRGQDVYINPDELEYSARTGIEVDTLYASNITMRDQTSDAIAGGGNGAVIVDVRPAGTSLLPDARIDTIDNASFAIIDNPAGNDAKTVECRSVITALGGTYNQRSLAQYIICQYVYWQRLERRIDIKQCLMAGKSGCI